MNSQIWFIRRTKTPCPVCEEFYVPHEDRQRYCYPCGVWMDIECIGEDDDSPDFEVPSNQGTLDIETLRDGFPEILNEVMRRPTVRGHMDEYNFNNNWATTGSGSQQGLIQEWRDGGALPENWLALLGESFLWDFVIEKTWKAYSCPRCSRSI
ncbi:hypothetical protein L208DRAFT_1343335 [Tricholoma matsutake]|nr:hypothetical protein L208DRAFT_1343335 [Tricholoma matsutake 945]